MPLAGIVRNLIDTHLAEETDIEPKGACIHGARIHEIAHHEDDREEAGEALALSDLLAGCCHRDDLRLNVFHLLIKLEL